MKKASNSDFIEFACLTNENIGLYLLHVPLDVEELTIWNYKMCLRPRFLEEKESLFIPSLKRFHQLTSVKIYSERLAYFPDIPESIQKILLISTIVDKDWYNICFNKDGYRLCVKNRCVYSYPVRPDMSAISLFNSLTPYVVKPEPPLKLVDDVPFYRRIFQSMSSFYHSFFSTKTKVHPKEIEMVPKSAIDYKSDINDYQHSMASIQRLKKIYEILIEGGVISFRIIDP